MFRRLISDPRLRPLRTALWPLVRWGNYTSERYVWLELDLSAVRPMRSRFVEGLELRLATHEDLPVVRRIGVPDLHRFDEYRSAGGELWLGDTPDGVAVAFWIFHRGMPLYPWLELPPRTVAVEHTTVSAEIRGLGFAPAAVTAKLLDLGDSGYEQCVTKIIDTNRPSLKTARRIGFRPTTLMYARRILGRTRIVVDAWTPFARHLGTAVRASGAVGAGTPSS